MRLKSTKILSKKKVMTKRARKC